MPEAQKSHSTLIGVVREALEYYVPSAGRRYHEAQAALNDIEECLDALCTRNVHIEEQLDAVREAMQLALDGIPDSQHPEIPRWAEDRLVAPQIVLADALGDDDPGNVEMARETLRALSSPAKREP